MNRFEFVVRSLVTKRTKVLKNYVQMKSPSPACRPDSGFQWNTVRYCTPKLSMSTVAAADARVMKWTSCEQKYNLCCIPGTGSLIDFEAAQARKNCRQFYFWK